MPKVNVQVAEKLVPLFTESKRLKVAVGGRAASKSFAFADAFTKFMSDGHKVLCGREYQNSIEDSVHSLFESRIAALKAPGFDVQSRSINHSSGGGAIYKGLARNIQSIKSLHNIGYAWIEEGQTLSRESIEVLMPTIREAGSEVWISANRGSSRDAFSTMILKRAEKDLEKYGYYADDDMLVIQINWRDNPFWNDTLEQQRVMDFNTMPRARYDHVWEGNYADTVDNAIIEPDWFDACVDAHEKLGFQAEGIEVVAHDPADSGDDKALVYRHGSVIKQAMSKADGDVNDACDWATGYAANVKADQFIWDAGGLGLSLKRQISDSLRGKKCQVIAFNGGSRPDFPDRRYDPIDIDVQKAKTNKDTFTNKRSQYYGMLRDRVFRTYLAVTKGRYINPDELISFSSGISDMSALRSELCRIPRKENGSGKLQILSKPEMKLLGIESPNLADAVMMSLASNSAVQTQTVDYGVPKAFSAFG